jgi:hypothetical protein
MMFDLEKGFVQNIQEQQMMSRKGRRAGEPIDSDRIRRGSSSGEATSSLPFSS